MNSQPDTSKPAEQKAREPWYLRYQLAFRGRDQVTIAIVIMVCFAGWVFWATVKYHRYQGIIDVDHAPSKTATYLVDINSAEWPEIANLPGIGPKLAQKIIEYRETHGNYMTEESLLDVSGIGPAKLKKLKSHLAPIEIPSTE